MSVKLTMVVALNSVPITLAPSSATATLATDWMGEDKHALVRFFYIWFVGSGGRGGKVGEGLWE